MRAPVACPNCGRKMPHPEARCPQCLPGTAREPRLTWRTRSVQVAVVAVILIALLAWQIWAAKHRKPLHLVELQGLHQPGGNRAGNRCGMQNARRTEARRPDGSAA